MAQTSGLPNSDDFYMSEWPPVWSVDQPVGAFDALPGPVLVADATPMLGNTPDITVTNDIRSLHIMICSRLDKIGSSLARIDGETAHIRENLEKTAEVGNRIRDMIDALRKGLHVFSKFCFPTFGETMVQMQGRLALAEHGTE